MSAIDLSTMRDALDESPRRGGSRPLPTLPNVRSFQDEMDLDVSDSEEWTIDQASIDYLRNLTSKPAGHPHARRVPVTNTWIQAKSRDIPKNKRDRLLAGGTAEDALPGYDINKDPDACFQLSKFGTGSSLAIQKCIREHVKYLRSKDGSRQAFPNGRLTNVRRQQFLAIQLDDQNPDLGSTADACCPDLVGKASSAWNLTFINSVAKDFVSAVRTGMYLDYDLPAEAKNERLVKRRITTYLRSMIKKDHKLRRLETAERIDASKQADRYMQRRRMKHQARLRTCDKSVKYSKYFALLKAIGPEGNSDEETDTEAGVDPLPIKIYSMKWRSKAYERLLHNLDKEAAVKETHPLLHSGPLRAPTRTSQATRNRIRTSNTAKKTLPISCPLGKPSQFYDSAYLQDAKRAGLLPHLCVGTAYVHGLPRE